MSYCCLSAVLLLLRCGFCCPHAQVLRKYGLLGEEEVDALEALGEAVQLAQLTAAQEEEMLGDVPDEFLVRSLGFAAGCTHCHFWDPGAPFGCVSITCENTKHFESVPGFKFCLLYTDWPCCRGHQAGACKTRHAATLEWHSDVCHGN